jgi:two-component system sensor histidine kinase KdpD
VEALGGTYHQVVGDDVPRTLVEFARSVDATQLVIGASRRSRLTALLTGAGIGATVVRESGDIDVHIVTHAAAARGVHLPRVTGGALSVKRRILGFAVALVGGPLLSWLLFAVSNDDSITADVLAYQLLVVVVALVGGIWPALFAAVLSGLTLDFLFIDPLFTVTIADLDHALSLVLYVVIAILVSWVVDQAARRTRVAQRAAAESELLATVAGSVLRGESAVPALVSRAREAFGMTGVRLVAADGAVIATDGEPVPDDRMLRLPVGEASTPRAFLELHGGDLDASARRLLDVMVVQLGAALERTALTETAREADALAETDQVRTALLSAVSHDLRRPLAAAVAAIGGLRAAGDSLSEDDRAELLATADESLATLSALVTDLLDVSRVEAGVLAVSLAPVDAAGTILAAVDELGLGPDEVELALDPDLPFLRADPVLLQRVVVNVLANAVRYTAPGTRVRVATSSLGPRAQIRIVDHGVGVLPERQDDIFAPFQRLGDTDNTTGLGLGLALSRGFAEGMGGTLTPEDTPGGGLTMVVELPIAEALASVPSSGAVS